MITSQPYPGLRPFESDEADVFFGREEQTDELLTRLGKTRFLAIIGASGCGKSSLVRAGMIPSLETGFMAAAGSRWSFVQLRPGSHPIRRLANALIEQAGLMPEDGDKNEALGFLNATLRRGPLGLVEALQYTPLPPQTNLLILVDQFEEIFRFRREGDRDEADAFVALLLACTRQRDLPIYVAITMRSDFIGDCAVFNGLPEALNQSQYLTPRLTREQLRAAIVGPARVFGGDVEPELVNSLLNEMGTDPDQLPLLQHLLMRVWNRAASHEDSLQAAADDDTTGRLLTVQIAEAVGGLKRALSNHLDEAYGELDDRQQKMAEALFRRLSERGVDQRDIRRPTSAAEIEALTGASLGQLVAIVDTFRAPTRSFLVPCCLEPIYSETVLDITHESLIRQWERLRGWAEAEAQSAETYRLLEQAARRWQQGLGGFWRTPDLEAALAWKDREQSTAPWARRYGGDFDLAMHFLAASEQERQAEMERVEALRQREVRRLRRSRAILAAVCASMVAGGIFLWDGLSRDHATYYNGFVKRWGIPQGIGELNKDQVRHRAVSLKFITKGRNGPVMRVEAVDSHDQCNPNNDVGTYLELNPEPSPLRECAWEFLRDQSGHMVYENAYNKFDQLVWGVAYTPYKYGQKTRSAYFLGPDGFPQPRKNAAAEIIVIEYSDTGDEIGRRFFDRRRNRQPGIDKAYGMRKEYYSNGLVRRIISLDADDSPMNDNVGNAVAQYEYDELGNTTRGVMFDKTDKKVLSKDGFSEVRLKYDQSGNRTTITYFDTVGQPTRYKQHCHKGTFRYDDAGNTTEMACFDGAGQPTLDENSCQLTQYTYDEKGNPTEGACFDQAGHKPASFSGGHHQFKKRYDNQGNVVEWRYFDTENQPTFVSDGNYKATQAYDSQGHVTEDAYFDAQDRPMRIAGGYHKEKREVDERGNETAHTYFDTDGSATNIDDGYHKVTSVYNERGNVTERRYFDSKGNPVINQDGYHLEKSNYNDRGQMIGQAFFGTDDAPVLAKNGYHQEKRSLDERGNVTERAFFDTKIQPVLHKDGYHRQNSRYDDRDQPIEQAFFGTDDAPILLKDGYHRQTLAYDDRGNKIEQAYFGKDQQKVIHPDGYHKVTYRYDENGNTIEWAYFSPDGTPVQHKGGYAVMRHRYLDTGRTLEESYLDVEGKPTNQTNGCYIGRAHTDIKGRLVEATCFDAAGHPLRNRDGYSRYTKVYNNFGDVTEQAYFGEDGKPLLQPEGYAISRQTYDEHRRITEQSYYGEDGKLRRLPDGYARLTKSYDELGNETETAYFGEDGKPVVWKDGYAIFRRSYDDHGRLLEQSYFGEDGKLRRQSNGYARFTREYDNLGHQTAEAYFKEDGKLVRGPDGFATGRARYDDHGRMIETSFHDETDALTSNVDGLARVIIHYDDDGKSSISLQGAHGEILERHTKVVSIRPGSQAERLGLKPGDIIQRYNGREIKAMEELIKATKEPGDVPRELVVRRGKAVLKFQVQPGLIGIEMRNILEPVPAQKPSPPTRSAQP
ncbi:MAG: PDZ domain-containing protein [Candidatus Methylumidiphilus sp.]